MKKNMQKTKNLTGPPAIGSIVEGDVVARGKSSVFLDLGLWGTGIIYGKEYQRAKNTLKDIDVGEKLSTKLIQLENEEGYRELSLSAAQKEVTWEELKETKKKGESLEVKILGANKGGLLAKISGVKAFLPVSQLSPEHYPRVEDGDKQKILKKLQEFVGEKLELKILNLDPDQEKLILSEKAKTKEESKKILKQYEEGDVVEGEVTGIAEFGAFIKFPADTKKGEPQLEGLCHISELDWKLIEDPSEIVKTGDKVKVKIIKIDQEKNQVFLSIKRLKENPWKKIEEKYKKGDIVKGKVTKFNPFGAFIQITPKVQGLCHISEFGSQEKMKQELEIGKKYDFKVSSIEPEEHRIILKPTS